MGRFHELGVVAKSVHLQSRAGETPVRSGAGWSVQRATTGDGCRSLEGQPPRRRILEWPARARPALQWRRETEVPRTARTVRRRASTAPGFDAGGWIRTVSDGTARVGRNLRHRRAVVVVLWDD